MADLPLNSEIYKITLDGGKLCIENHSIVVGCKNDSECGNENITFHRFPKKNTTIKSWATAIGRPNWSPTKSSRVCSDHFEDKCFRKTEHITILRPGSIPKLLKQDKKRESRVDTDDCTNSDSPRAKKLKEEILMFRKKSKEDEMKIKCLQGKIRRVLRKQGKYKVISRKGRGLNRRRTPSLSADESKDSTRSSSPAPCLNIKSISLNKEEVHSRVKCQLMDDNDMGAGPSLVLEDPNMELEECMVEDDIKVEIEDDPLMALGDTS